MPSARAHRLIGLGVASGSAKLPLSPMFKLGFSLTQIMYQTEPLDLCGRGHPGFFPFHLHGRGSLQPTLYLTDVKELRLSEASSCPPGIRT